MAYPHELLRAVARGETVAGSDVTPEVADSAIEHRMAALLYESMDDEGDTADAGAASLVAFDLAVRARRQQQERVFGLVHDRLEAAGVTHTFVKGRVSAIRWFEQPSDRPYSDIDVVVPKGPPFAKAVAVLDPANPAVPVLESHESTGALSSVDVALEGVHVDIQTDALRMGLTPNAYRNWSVGMDELGDGGLRVLDIEHDLVMFLLHQGRDRFRYLLGVAEARLRLNSPVDWSRVEAISREEGIWEQVAVALEVMCEELRRDVPVDVPRNWRTALWRRLWQPDVRFLGEMGRIRHVARGKWLMPLTMRGRLWEAVSWMGRAVFPGEAVLRLRYPESKGPYLWRVLWLRGRVITRRRFWVWRNRSD